ncbi:hypothetical protein GCM10022245_16320 [Streptomyces mayteni]
MSAAPMNTAERNMNSRGSEEAQAPPRTRAYPQTQITRTVFLLRREIS